MIDKSNTWCLYMHISPSAKIYVGITHYSDPSKRWGNNGSQYDKRTVFSRAINRYGWDNFKHVVLFRNCSESFAKDMEKLFISFYKSINMSYNMTIGGDGHNFGKESKTKEYRTQSSRKFRKDNPNFDKEQYQKHKEKKKELARNYYRRNRERVLQQKKSEYYKEKSRERCYKWRREHPDYMKNYMKKYNEEHRNKKHIENG